MPAIVDKNDEAADELPVIWRESSWVELQEVMKGFCFADCKGHGGVLTYHSYFLTLKYTVDL